MEPNSKYLIVITGPTAIGKSNVAIQVAKQFLTEIVGADSRQIYREMKIGTARADFEEMEGIKHHLIGQKSIHNVYTAGSFEKEVLTLLENIFRKKQMAILCGGTGLYIKSVLEGLDEFPAIPDEIQQKWNAIFEMQGLEHVQKVIKELDPVYSQTVDLENARRLLRAICVSEYSGQPYSSFLGKERTQRKFIPIKINLEMDRALLYERINKRVDQMFAKGLLEEAKQLYKYKNESTLQTVGYQELFQYFEGTISMEEAIRLIKRNTRRYAKRQMTWIRNSEGWTTFHPQDIHGIIEFIAAKMG